MAQDTAKRNDLQDAMQCMSADALLVAMHNFWRQAQLQ